MLHFECVVLGIQFTRTPIEPISPEVRGRLLMDWARKHSDPMLSGWAVYRIIELVSDHPLSVPSIDQ
jgi:hypothetical protein